MADDDSSAPSVEETLQAMRARSALRNLETTPTSALDSLQEIVYSDPMDLALVIDEETIQPLLAFLDAVDPLAQGPTVWPENAATVRSILTEVTEGHSRAATEKSLMCCCNSLVFG